MKNPVSYLSNFITYRLIPKEATLVLAYHNVINTSTVGNDLYSVTRDNFIQHINILKRNFSVISPAELSQDSPIKKPRILITFDDGKENNFTEALPILRESGFPALYFITTGFVGRQGYMSEEEIKQAAHNAIHIGSHSVTHADFGLIGNTQTAIELKESKQFLDTLTNTNTVSFSYPYGNLHNTKESDRELLQKLGYTHAFVFGPFNNYRMNDLYRIPRLAVTDVLGQTFFWQIVRAFLLQKVSKV
jgi:peptidoglycan/xylan/chitin deacetylase (PgdA/CDA1 family)